MTDEEFIKICQNAKSMADAARLTGLQFTSFKVKATQLGCYNTKKKFKALPAKERLKEILKGKDPTYQPYKLKTLLFKFHIKENKCEKCGISDWYGKPLQCELHHIDGNKYNHKLENLIILCPNCHSQTETFRFKRGKINK